MKRRLKYFTYLSTLLTMPMTAVAVSGWTGYAPVEELTSTAHGRFLVKLKVSENPSGCSNKETFYKDNYSLGSEQMYFALLKSVESGKKVRVYVTGRCELNGYSEISSVSIVP